MRLHSQHQWASLCMSYTGEGADVSVWTVISGRSHLPIPTKLQIMGSFGVNSDFSLLARLLLRNHLHRRDALALRRVTDADRGADEIRLLDLRHHIAGNPNVTVAILGDLGHREHA